MRFSLFGIPVHVQPMFWLVALVLGAPGGTSPREVALLAIWMIVLFVSILAHELGHAFAMRRFGRAPSIELWGLGGLTSWGEGPAPTPGKDIVVSLAGPIAGLLLGGLVYAVSSTLTLSEGSLAAEAVRQALWINVIWGLVNLAPILPLDGGHVLASGAAWVGGARGRRIAYGISLVLAVAVIGWALWQRRLWIAFLAVWCASISYKGWSSPLAAEPPSPIPEAVQDGVRAVWRLLFQGQADRAAHAAEALLASIAAGDEHAPARGAVLEALAWARLEAGDEAGALEAARRIAGQPSELLRARLAIAEGRVADGLAQLERAFEEDRSSMPAMVLAATYIDQERPDFALAMLGTERGSRLSAGTQQLLGAQLFHAGHFELALQACQLGFERFRTPVFAYNAACSLARLGRVDEGLDWLARAIDAGFDERAQLDDDQDIAALRADPRFQALREKLG